MDVVIFDMGGMWGMATPSLDERRAAPFNIVLDKVWRIWPADELPGDLWESAKAFFLALCDDDETESEAA